MFLSTLMLVAFIDVLKHLIMVAAVLETAPNWPKMGPRWPQDGPKMDPSWPQAGMLDFEIHFLHTLSRESCILRRKRQTVASDAQK